MRYGKRIMNGHNGDVQWCELSPEEVAEALSGNVALNAKIYEYCTQAALAQKGLSLGKKEDRATLAVNPYLEREVREITRALFDQCGVKGFVALQEALAEKVHVEKSNGHR